MKTKREIKALLGYSTDSQLAELFGVTRAAVHNWDEDSPIPRERWLLLRYELHPELFDPDPPTPGGEDARMPTV